MKNIHHKVLFKNAINAFPSWLRGEFRILAILCVVAGGIYGFLKLAGNMLEGETHAFDASILYFFRNTDYFGAESLPFIMTDITALGGTTVLTLITVSSLIFLYIEKKRATALLLFFSVMGGTILSSALKLGFERPRPDLVPHLVEVSSLSFPSGHAMLSAVTYLTLGAILARAQDSLTVRLYIMCVAVALTLMVGLSRVYLGVHWPTDVLAGWCLGAAWALSCWLVANWLQKRGQIEKTRPRP